MKNGLTYFFKTQLTIMFVFNFMLLLAYIPLIIFSLVVFGMLNVHTGMTVYSYVACAVPVIVFFSCGVYFKNAKNYYLSYMVPGFFLSSGKNSKKKSAIVKPENAFLRYLPIFFPLIYTVISSLFYEQARFHQMILLVNVPYNWIFLTPVWFYVFSDSTLNSLLFPVILPLASYAFFIIGYILGDKPMFYRIFKENDKREDRTI